MSTRAHPTTVDELEARLVAVETDLEARRERASSLAYAISRKRFDLGDVGDLQNLQREVSRLESERAVILETLTPLRAAARQVAAEELAEAQRLERLAAADEAIATVNEYARIAREIEETTEHLADLFTMLREKRDVAQQVVRNNVMDEQPRNFLMQAVASLSLELDRLGEFVRPYGGGKNIEGGDVKGAGALAALRVDRAVLRIREVLAYDDGSTEPTPT